MSPPVFVTFRHMAARAALEEYAREQAAHLARLHDGLVDCRVVLEPSEVGVLRVLVELTLPGERLVAAHESEPDGDTDPDAEVRRIPEYRWLHALHEAFVTAERLLHEYAGRRHAAHGRARRTA
jgi:hypothetical protein